MRDFFLRGIPPALADFSEWASTVAWLLVSGFGAGYSYLEYQDVRREWAFAKTLTNGRRVVALYRLRTAYAFVAGFSGASLAGILAVLGLFLNPPSQKSKDDSLQAAILRSLLVSVLACFLVAKKNQRSVRQRLNDIAAAREAAAEREKEE